jgi:hypothetical protein
LEEKNKREKNRDLTTAKSKECTKVQEKMDNMQHCAKVAALLGKKDESKMLKLCLFYQTAHTFWSQLAWASFM